MIGQRVGKPQNVQKGKLGYQATAREPGALFQREEGAEAAVSIQARDVWLASAILVFDF